MNEFEGWLGRKLDEAEAYRKEFSAWADFKFTLAGLFIVAAPALILACFGAALFFLLG